MGFRGSVESALRQYATFGGRAPRAEYWWFYLFTILVGLAASIIDGAAGTNLVSPLASLALFLPSLAVGVRRLHDSNLSGWWILAPMLCGILAAVLIVVGVATAVVDRADGGANRATGVAVLLLFLGLLMLVVAMVVGLVLMVRRSTPGPNRFGPHPYGQHGETPYGGPGVPQSDPYGNHYGDPYGGQPGPYPGQYGQPGPYPGRYPGQYGQPGPYPGQYGGQPLDHND